VAAIRSFNLLAFSGQLSAISSIKKDYEKNKELENYRLFTLKLSEKH
jgi:hypothetical protein